MGRVYKNMDEVEDNLEFIPGFDSKGKLCLDVCLDGKKIDVIDKDNNKIKVKVKIAEEEKVFAAVRLTFDVFRGLLTVDPGRRGANSYTVRATSGVDGYMNNPILEDKEWKGSIPHGVYRVALNELTNPGWLKDRLRNLIFDWGDWRVPLYPIAVVETTRKNFFLHGGSKPGSAGCIDIGGGLKGDATTNRVLKDLLADSDGIAVLTVK